jgi:thiol-disulfide isomerase/thioredoxin
MFIFPNDSMTVSFDENKVIQSIVYKGNRENEYNYFIKYRQKFNLPYGMFTKPDWSDIFEMNPDEFKRYRKEKVRTDLEFFYSYCLQNRVSEEFKVYAKAEIEYSYFYALISYPSLRQYFKKIYDTLPPDFYNEINSNLFQLHRNIVSQNYLNALKVYIYKYMIGDNKNSNEFYKLAFDIAQKTYSDTSLYCFETLLIKDMFLSDIRKDLRDSIYNAFQNSCTIPDFSEYVKELYYLNNNIINVFPEEVLTTILINTSGEKQSLKDFLRSSKGKVIYMDVWASYCGPCRIEMPYSIQLHQKFINNESVKFVYLSIDSENESWKKAIGNLKMNGDNYLIQDGLRSKLCQYLNIIGVPHYILLDKNGKIILPSAARPSSVSTETSIKELLEIKTTVDTRYSQ